MRGPQKLEVSLARRRWLKPQWHFLGLVVVFAFVAAAWRGVHLLLNAKYRAETEPTIVAALNYYQLSYEGTPSNLVVMVSGEKFDQTAESLPGTLGLDRLAGMRGVLIDHAGQLRDYRSTLDARYEALRSLWMPNPRQPKSREFDFRAAGIVDSGDTLLQCPAREWQALLDDDPVHGLDKLHNFAIASVVRERALRAPTSLSTSSSARESVNSTQRVARSLAESAIKKREETGLPEPLPTYPERAMRESERDALRRFFLGPFIRDLEKVKALAFTAHERWANSNPEFFGCIGPDAETIERWIPRERAISKDASLSEAFDIVRESRAELFRLDLYSVMSSETGLFWFFGSWKWFEIMWWTVFGVLTMALYSIGFASITGKQPGKQTWEPGESLRVVGRMFYAPAIAVVFFWLALSTNLIEEASFLASNTFGALAFAFVIGMAPNHVLRLVLNVLFLVMRGGAKGKELSKSAKTSGRTVVSREPNRSEGELPTLEQLKNRVVRIATAPLE